MAESQLCRSSVFTNNGNTFVRRYTQPYLVVCVGLSDLFGGVYQSGESEEKMFLLAIRKSNRNYLLYVFRDMLGREIMVAAVIKSM